MPVPTQADDSTKRKRVRTKQAPKEVHEVKKEDDVCSSETLYVVPC